MPDIKTRDAVKKTVKVIDKSAVAAERMKDAYVRCKSRHITFQKAYKKMNLPRQYLIVTCS